MIRNRVFAALALTVLLAACESERTIPTKRQPSGEIIPCVGITGKGRVAGIDYDWSGRNVFWAIFGAEIIYPPIAVLNHETFCPIADT